MKSNSADRPIRVRDASVSLNVDIRPDLFDAVEQAIANVGLSKRLGVSRILMHFVALSPDEQLAILVGRPLRLSPESLAAHPPEVHRKTKP
jgi:hypothetical protein